MKKEILIILTLIILPLISTSQIKTHPHEFGVYGSGGLSNLNGKINTGNKKNGIGYNFGIDYTYMFAAKFGITLGIEYASYNFSTNLNEFSDSYMITDSENENFIFGFSFLGTEETQQLQYANIPVIFKYQGGDKLKYYAGIGCKIGIPLKGQYSTPDMQIKTTAYYPEHDLLIDDLKFKGFGTFDIPSGSNELELKTSFMLTAEAGFKFLFGKISNLYIGAFIDYGLNNIIKSGKDQAYITYNEEKPMNYNANSMLNSKFETKAESYIKKTSVLYAGLKIKYSFGKRRNKFYNLIEGDVTN